MGKNKSGKVRHDNRRKRPNKAECCVSSENCATCWRASKTKPEYFVTWLLIRMTSFALGCFRVKEEGIDQTSVVEVDAFNGQQLGLSARQRQRFSGESLYRRSAVLDDFS
ncbi:hypothetical protein CAPTEDRAFT_213650 [Capitella teleta]|uniref:Uncharacterized protein n=1 Tax=Capitella teleta TaxID=283909 RepID=R7VJA3_CAPTE|nr:hypothetical protein CAPTEDRAFT_213650 [Capitella teleta]|eukprot:ELU16426.1 hypothetical protein CAPTEDRAFT_213650 [Capitella teleta]